MTEQFSLQVSRALSDLGYDEEIRQYRIARYSEEIFLCNLSGHKLFSQYMLSGSKSEGTSKFSESDFDYLLIRSNVKAKETEDFVQGESDLILFMEDNTAPPGYCKLMLQQCGCRGKETHDTFIMFNCYVSCPGYCRPHLSSAAVLQSESAIINLFLESKTAGPANSGYYLGTSKIDAVLALRCAHMPKSFINWIRQHQDHDWPAKQTIEEIARSDIFLVAVGMHDTDLRHLQWRVSFNIPEKILIQNFTTVQYKIYVLLKMIKREIVQPRCPESITSYIVKTLMLWAVEQIPAQIWSNRNLIDLLFHVLHVLYRCIKCGFCPMYFIPECNILHGRLTKVTQNIICDILSSLLSDRISCILKIPKILTQLHQYIFVPMPLRGVIDHRKEKTNIAMAQVRKVHVLSLCLTNPEKLLCCQEEEHARVSYEEHLTYLMSTPTPAGSEMEKLVKYIFSQIMLQLTLQDCADASIHHASNIHKYGSLRRCVKILYGNCSNDVLYGRVKLAQVLCMIGQYKAAKSVLESAADRIRHYTQKHGRRRMMQKYDIHQKLINVCEKGNVSTSLILKTFFLSDIQYDHLMELCLPKSFQYELYRTKYHECRTFHTDPQTVLYYLQYLSYKELGLRNHTKVALGNLAWCATRYESNIEYKEVALNILGHCLMKKRLYDKAARVLVKSVKLVNQVNQYKHLGPSLCTFLGLTPEIALWHIAILLYKVHRNP